MTKRISRDEMFMRIAHVVSERGTCPRAKVGAIIVTPKTHKIVSIGYNGNPPGQPHCEDVGCVMVAGHCSTAIHAEANALMHLTDPGVYDGYIMYVTHKPCKYCTDAIINGGIISKVIYDIPYRHEGPDNFVIGGVTFERYSGPQVQTL